MLELLVIEPSIIFGGLGNVLPTKTRALLSPRNGAAKPQTFRARRESGC
jgi:hypothetical protein